MAAIIMMGANVNTVSAQSNDIEQKVKTYFQQELKVKERTAKDNKEAFVNHSICSTDIEKETKGKEIASFQSMVWKAWCEANRELQEEKLIPMKDLKDGNHGKWDLPACLEPNAAMPFYYGVKGESESKLPFFIYLHGSGPKDQEWTTGLKLGNLFQDAPSVYFIPQIPNEGEYYRWWQLAKQFAWEKLLRITLSEGRIDANRLYMFGISEGGYGSQRLASFYADYFAAVGPMAGGEPLKNAPVENCANIGFSFLTGAVDQGFYRNILTYYTQVAFDSIQLAHPLSADGKPLFLHRINLLPNMQHSIDYRLTPPWLKAFTRNPYPKTVLWEDFELDGRHRSGFYNLQVLDRPSENRTYYEMNIKDNIITLSIDNVEYTTIQKDPQWGIEMKFNRTYSKATGGKLRVYLNDKLVDMNREVTVIINGKQVFKGKVKANLRDMIDSSMEFYDPYRVFPSSVTVVY